MQSPTFSDRTQRLADKAESLLHQLRVVWTRIANVDHAIARGETLVIPEDKQADALHINALLREERDQASQALYEVQREQGRILAAQQRHDWLPDGTLLLVLVPDGSKYVVERRDGDRPLEHGDWYHLDSPDFRMTFSEAISVDEGNAEGYEFVKLYTPEQVDDMLDRAGVPDSFV